MGKIFQEITVDKRVTPDLNECLEDKTPLRIVSDTPYAVFKQCPTCYRLYGSNRA